VGVAYVLKATTEKDDMLKTTGLQQWRKSLEINPAQPELQQLYQKYTSQ